MANKLRWIVVGNGNQGSKHRTVLGSSCVGLIDENSIGAGLTALGAYPLDDYDAIVIATPEEVKNAYVKFALSNSKKVLVEKPFIADIDTLQLIQNSLEKGVNFETAYDHMYDPGIIVFIEKFNEVQKNCPPWSSLKMDYSFGTEALIKESSWLDFGTGPWEIVAPHLLRLICELQVSEKLKLDYFFGFANLKSPSSVTAISSGNHFVEISTSYTSWLNNFSIKYIWDEGSIELNGLTKWGGSNFKEYKRVYPAGLPETIQKIEFPGRTPLDAVRTMHENVFKLDPKQTLTYDSTISQIISQARVKLDDRNYAP